MLPIHALDTPEFMVFRLFRRKEKISLVLDGTRKGWGGGLRSLFQGAALSTETLREEVEETITSSVVGVDISLNQAPNTLNTLQHAIGVQFNNTVLLEQALTHRSYLNEHPGEGFADYERLEYLGDAFLGWVIADELYRRHSNFTEGDLTRGRASLVRGTTLAEIASRFDAGAYLIMGSGEEGTGGRGRRATLAAIVEALIGAVLQDQGEPEARQLVLRWLGPAIAAMNPAGAPRDAKSALQEASQRTGSPIPMYELISEEGPSHDKTFQVVVLIDSEVRGRGEGRRKIDAEQVAAAQALNSIDSTVE